MWNYIYVLKMENIDNPETNDDVLDFTVWLCIARGWRGSFRLCSLKKKLNNFLENKNEFQLLALEGGVEDGHVALQQGHQVAAGGEPG